MKQGKVERNAIKLHLILTEFKQKLFSLQIKTAATSFTLGKMIAGEKYEMTIRSATSQDAISGTASIVEITMPRGSVLSVEHNSSEV